MKPKDQRFKQFIIDNKYWLLAATLPHFSGVTWARPKEGEDEEAHEWDKTDRSVTIHWQRIEKLFMKRNSGYRGMGRKKIAKLAEFMQLEYGSAFDTLKSITYDSRLFRGY